MSESTIFRLILTMKGLGINEVILVRFHHDADAERMSAAKFSRLRRKVLASYIIYFIFGGHIWLWLILTIRKQQVGYA